MTPLTENDASDRGMPGHAAPIPVESLRGELADLLRERESLHASGAGQDDLERNRQAIVRVNQAISRALIARHSPRLQPA